MKRAALALAAACSHAAPAPPPAANHVAAPAAPTTHLTVQVFPAYRACEQLHHLAVSVDGVPRVTIETHSQCSPPPRHVNGGTVTVTDSTGRSDTSPPFDVPPGPHAIEVRDREAGRVQKIDRVFPVYDDRDHRVIERLGVAVDDDTLRILGLSHVFLVL